MRGIRSLVVAVLVLTLGCGGKAAPPAAAPAARAEVPVEPAAPPLVVEDDALPEIPTTPQAAPADLLAVASIGDPIATLAALAAYADAVRPGIGAMVTPGGLIQMAAANGLDLSGIDLSRPARAFLLDPGVHPAPVVVVVAVADEKALRAQVGALGQVVVIHAGWAAIGTPAALRAAAPHALTTAIAPSTRPQVSIAMRAVMARYRPVLAAYVEQAIAAQPPAMQSMTAASMRAYLDLFDQLDRVDLTLEVDRDRASVQIALAARPGSAVAGFAGQQRAGDFKLLERMGSAPMVMGGRLETAQVFGQLMALSQPMMESMYGPQVASTAVRLFAQWPVLANGENAATLVPVKGKVAAAMLWDISDGAAAQALWFDYLSQLGGATTGTMSTTVDVDAARYRGVRFARARSTSNQAMMQASMAMYGGQLEVGYAVPGKLFAVAIGPDVIAQLRGLTDVAVPKKRTAPRVDAALAATLAWARSHQISYLIAGDAPAVRAAFVPGSPAAQPARELSSVALEFGPETVALRVTLPASQLAPLLP